MIISQICMGAPSPRSRAKMLRTLCARFSFTHPFSKSSATEEKEIEGSETLECRWLDQFASELHGFLACDLVIICVQFDLIHLHIEFYKYFSIVIILTISIVFVIILTGATQ